MRKREDLDGPLEKDMSLQHQKRKSFMSLKRQLKIAVPPSRSGSHGRHISDLSRERVDKAYLSMDGGEIFCLLRSLISHNRRSGGAACTSHTRC